MTPRQRADRFLFAPVNPRGAAMLRVLTGLALVYFFWPNGAGPKWPWNAHPAAAWMFEHVWLTWPYFALCAAGCLVFALGWRPRVVGCVLLVLLAPLDCTVVGFISRQLLLVTLLCVTLGGAGKTQAPMWTVRLIQLQLTLVYLANAVAKTTPAFLSGDILVGLSRMMPNFLMDLSDGYVHLGPVTVSAAVAAWGTVITEYFLALGWWLPRMRWPTAVVGVAFHVSLLWVVAISKFDMAAMFLYVSFLLPLEESTTPPQLRSGGL